MKRFKVWAKAGLKPLSQTLNVHSNSITHINNKSHNKIDNNLNNDNKNPKINHELINKNYINEVKAIFNLKQNIKAAWLGWLMGKTNYRYAIVDITSADINDWVFEGKASVLVDQLLTILCKKYGELLCQNGTKLR